jgi:hypothetical protein
VTSCYLGSFFVNIYIYIFLIGSGLNLLDLKLGCLIFYLRVFRIYIIFIFYFLHFL